MKTAIQCLIFATIIASASVTAQPRFMPGLGSIVCGDREEATENLRKKFGEVAVWTGDSEHTSFVLHLSESGSWTMLMFHPVDDQKMCWIGSGENGFLTGEEPAQPTEKPAEGGTGPLHGA